MELATEAKYELISIDRLRANTWNPNTMTDEMFNKAVSSIIEYGFIDPITVMPYADGYTIIDGEHRWRAADQLGYREVPCVVLRTITHQQAKKLTTILNGLHGEADPEKLSVLLKDLLDAEPAESLLRTLPYSTDEFNSLAGLTAFDWDAFNEKMAQPRLSDKEPWVERTYRMPESAAAVIDRAIAAIKTGEDDIHDWQALELICADYLAGSSNG